MEGTSIATALSTGGEILDVCWNWISGNPILFAVCCIGILVGGIHAVKSLF